MKAKRAFKVCELNQSNLFSTGSYILACKSRHKSLTSAAMREERRGKRGKQPKTRNMKRCKLYNRTLKMIRPERLDEIHPQCGTYKNGDGLRLGSHKGGPKSHFPGASQRTGNMKIRLFWADFQSELLGALLFNHSSSISSRLESSTGRKR